LTELVWLLSAIPDEMLAWQVPAHRSRVVALAFSLDGAYLATASEQGTVIRVFSVPAAEKLYTLRRCVGFGGKQLVGRWRNTFPSEALLFFEAYWSVNGAAMHRGSSPCLIYSLAFNRAATRIAVSSSSGTIHVFQLGAGRFYVRCSVRELVPTRILWTQTMTGEQVRAHRALSGRRMLGRAPPGEAPAVAQVSGTTTKSNPSPMCMLHHSWSEQSERGMCTHVTRGVAACLQPRHRVPPQRSASRSCRRSSPSGSPTWWTAVGPSPRRGSTPPRYAFAQATFPPNTHLWSHGRTGLKRPFFCAGAECLRTRSGESDRRRDGGEGEFSSRDVDGAVLPGDHGFDVAGKLRPSDKTVVALQFAVDVVQGGPCRLERENTLTGEGQSEEVGTRLLQGETLSPSTGDFHR
jgi:hypothetical protein